jgi:hypothetical protein
MMMTGPATDQKVVLLIALPEMTPTPLQSEQRPCQGEDHAQHDQTSSVHRDDPLR